MSDSDSDFEMEPFLSDDEFFNDADESNAESVADADEEEDGDIVLEPLFPANAVSRPLPNIPPTLRQRRQSKSDPLAVKTLLNQRLAAKTTIIEEHNHDNGLDIEVMLDNGKRCPKGLWKKALKLMRKQSDPWAEYDIQKYETHRVVRHRFNAIRKTWTRDECYVKMEPAPFNHGAMRECFRLKKMMVRKCDWLRAHNYVAKRYVQEVDRQVYFEDVILQMDAKLWGEEFNRHRPPKKVDIFQMAVIEFVDSPGAPLYHLEHFIEGEYIKYNSNSGFVDDHMRLTPQAFSHFTFERSGHELIVIDIQGVGDLYTDPQIHTADGTGYGDGNLGTRGMALFFHSHFCNKICETLKLAPFDLSDSEKKQAQAFKKLFDAATKIRGVEEMCISPSPKERIDLSKFLHHRSISCSSRGSTNDSGDAESHENMSDHELSQDEEHDDFIEPPVMFRPRYRTMMSESESDTWSKDDERAAFSNAMARNHRSSCVQAELSKLQLKRLSVQMSGMKVDKESESILGMIHLDLAKYHESARFVLNDSQRDHEAIYFHLEHAAQLGVMEAILTMARLHLDMDRELLAEYDAVDYARGLEYMESACDEGNRESAVLLGQSYQLGSFGLEVDWAQAIHFYEKAVELDDDGTCVSLLEHPNYRLMAAIAKMYAEGGNGIDPSPQKSYDLYNEAAEGAQAALKGQLAMKYYTLAEEVGAELEE